MNNTLENTANMKAKGIVQTSSHSQSAAKSSCAQSHAVKHNGSEVNINNSRNSDGVCLVETSLRRAKKQASAAGGKKGFRQIESARGRRN